MSFHLGPNVLLNVEEEFKPKLDLVPTPLLLMGVPNVRENLPRVSLVTTRSVQVSVLFMGLRPAELAEAPLKFFGFNCI